MLNRRAARLTKCNGPVTMPWQFWPTATVCRYAKHGARAILRYDGVSGCRLARTGRDVGRAVLRGGSWANDAHNVRSAYRNANDCRNRNENIGFRLALSLSQFGLLGNNLPAEPIPCSCVVSSPCKVKGTRCAGRQLAERPPGCRLLWSHHAG